MLAQPATSRRVPRWSSLVDGAARERARRAQPSARRIVRRFVIANLVAIILVLAGSVWASREAAKKEAIADARRATDQLATLLVEPALRPGVEIGDPPAISDLNGVVAPPLAEAGIVRVKLWTPEGRIVWSDEPRLINLTFPLSSDDREALEDGATRAEVSDLTRPENMYERSHGELLEVYRLVHTRAGAPLLLETYMSYQEATARQAAIWRAFAPISVTVLLGLVLIQLPLAYRMLAQLRATQQERELLQARALDTSTDERRRIAGSLHDGIVQDVSASALMVAGAADQLRDHDPAESTEEVAEVLGHAATALRESVGSLRSLLVEIYPPNLARAGLASALGDLAARLRPRGIDVTIVVPDQLDLPLETATLLFRTAQEALQNVVKHSRASAVEVTVRQLPHSWVLTVTDDGAGFDVDATRRAPRSGHLGLSVLTDLAAAESAELAVATAPGAGTSVRLEVPRP